MLTSHRRHSISNVKHRHFAFTHFLLCIVLMISCSRQGVPELPDSPVPAGTSNKIHQQLTGTANGKIFLSAATVSFGTPQWDRAIIQEGKGKSLCLLPFVRKGEDSITALAAISTGDHVFLRLFDAADYAAGSIADTSYVGRLIHWMNFKLFAKQRLSSKGMLFRNGVPEPVQSGRSAQITLSICYNTVSCTGDGYGNCVGNYTYRTECFSESYMLYDYSYTDLPAYSGGDPDYGTGGHGGGSGGTSPKDAVLSPPLTPIEILEAYLCFDRTAPATLKIYVDQPLPGADDPFTVLGKMGHAFVGIEQAGPNGTTRRFLGFYPKTPVNPFGNRVGPATIGNDQRKKYDLVLPIPLTPLQLQQVLSAIMNHKDTYDLENYNCADFCMDIAAAAGVNIPRNAGWWLIGRGRNPGRMGEDMRTMPGVITKRGRTLDNAGICD